MLPIPIGNISAGKTTYREPPTRMPPKATETTGSEFRSPN